MWRLVFLLLLLGPWPLWAGPVEADPCPVRFSEGDARAGKPCHCSPTAIKGAVWGTQTFTPDSSVCRAAMHVGLIGPKGGRIEYRATKGCPTYAKRSRNGVQTGSHTAHPESYYFPAVQSGRCGGQVQGTPCPTNFFTIAHSSGDLVCGCDASMVMGRVEGDGVYTAESPICTAAVHAGAIKDGEGQVRIRRAQPCHRVGGVTRNGIPSVYVSEMGLSYFFPDLGVPKCPSRGISKP